MQKISFAMFAMMMAGISCGGSAADNATASGNTPAVDDELAPGGPKTGSTATQVNLVSDEEGKARMSDPNLQNAWGLAFNPAGGAWVSANGTGVSPVYDASGNLRLTVTIPMPEGGKRPKDHKMPKGDRPPASPTGQVFNGQSDDFKGDLFIFVTEQGTIAGWQPSDETTAKVRVDNCKADAIYKGVAIAKARKGEARLLVTDFHNNKIDVYDDHYEMVHLDENAFSDGELPKGYAPFNVAAHDAVVLVTYALQDETAKDDVAGAGNGFVDVYDLNGRLMDRLISGGALNAPWGLAFTPEAKHEPSKLLVGNFGDGRVNTYRMSLREKDLAAKFAGPLLDEKHRPISIEGLWAIAYGPGAGGFDADELYFTAGPDDEAHGLFGKLVFGKE